MFFVQMLVVTFSKTQIGLKQCTRQAEKHMFSVHTIGQMLSVQMLEVTFGKMPFGLLTTFFWSIFWGWGWGVCVCVCKSLSMDSGAAFKNTKSNGVKI